MDQESLFPAGCGTPIIIIVFFVRDPVEKTLFFMRQPRLQRYDNCLTVPGVQKRRFMRKVIDITAETNNLIFLFLSQIFINMVCPSCAWMMRRIHRLGYARKFAEFMARFFCLDMILVSVIAGRLRILPVMQRPVTAGPACCGCVCPAAYCYAPFGIQR